MALNHAWLAGNTQGAQLVTLRGNLGADIFERAAQLLAEKYQVLRCCLSDGPLGHSLVLRDDVAGSAIRVRELTADAVATLEDEVAAVLDPAVSLWRLTAYRNARGDTCQIALTAHHAIIDGSGFAELLCDLFRFMDELASGGAVTVDPRDVPPPIDDFLLPASDATPKLAAACPPIRFFGDAELSQRKTRMLSVSLSKSSSLALEQRCKAMRVSVNAVLCANFAKAAAAHGCGGSAVKFKTAVSLRERAGAAATARHQLGCYITVADATLELDGKSVLQVARAYEQALLSSMLKVCSRRRAVAVDAMVANLQEIGASKEFDHGIGMTSAGALGGNAVYRTFRVVDWEITNSRVGGNVAVVLHTLTFDGALKLSLVYAEPLVERARIERIMTELERSLAGFAGATEAVSPAPAVHD